MGMDRKKYDQLRSLVALFVSVIVAVAVIGDSYVLVLVGIVTGMICMVLVRRQIKIGTDEREETVRAKAAQLTYAIFTSTIGIGAVLLLIPYQKLSPVFAKGEFAYLESLGLVLAYLTLFLIAIYALAHQYLNRQYGGSGHDE